ncbi:hypothetical protein [Modestobacter sp. NPDC049651]|uniref:hypothetical protein n=1 Tax=unclassified Modestobacter TaxID=2643866 RepID=UPI00340D1F2D
MALPPPIDDLVAEATGRRARQDAVVPPTGGPAGNARLTAWTGVLLLALTCAELVTLLDVSGLISWHVAIGALLVPVALLKTASTSWRIVRYYTGHRPYRAAGPPPLLLRVLGPLVVASTLGLLASGIVLVSVGDDRGHRTLFTALGRRVDLVTVHQALFIAFAVCAGLHLLARAVRAVELLTGRATRGPGGRTGVPGRLGRLGALTAAAVAALVAVVLLLPQASGWHDGGDDGDGGPPGAHAAVHRPPNG